MKKLKILVIMLLVCFSILNLALLFGEIETPNMQTLKKIEMFKRENGLQDGEYEILYDKGMQEYFVSPIENCEGIVTVSFETREDAEKCIEILEN